MISAHSPMNSPLLQTPSTKVTLSEYRVGDRHYMSPDSPADWSQYW